MPGKQHEPPLHASSKRWFRRLPLIGLVAILVSVVVGLFFLRSSDPSEQAVAEEVKVIEQRVREGKHEDAIRSLDRLQKHRNLPPDSAFRMAQLAMDLDAIALAEKFLDRAESSASFKAKVVYLRGVLALKDFRAAQAETLWKAAVNLNPKFISAWERLAQLAMSQMRGAELRAALDGLRTARLLSLDELVVYSSAFEPYYSAEERQSVVEKYALTDREDLPSFLAAARYRLLDDRIDDALLWLEKRGERPLTDLETELTTKIFIRKGDWDNAQAALARWSERDSLPVPISRGKGMLAAALGEWDRAAFHLRKVVLAEPHDTEALYQLGQSLQRTNHPFAATAALNLAAKNEQLNTLVYRVRRTSQLPPAKLAPLFLQTAQYLDELGRTEEALLWLQQSEPYLKSDASYQEVAGKLFSQLTNKFPQSDLQTISSTQLTIDAPSEVSSTRSTPGENPFPPALPQFLDVHESAGLQFQYEAGSLGRKWLLETLGGGVAVLDYDGDDWPDLYFSQGCRIAEDGSGVIQSDGAGLTAPRDKLFRNLGNDRFKEVTLEAGLGDENYSQGCTAGDFDQDGDADLIVLNYGQNVLYRNNGDGTFTDVTLSAGIAGNFWHTSAAFSDVDLDGDLDLFVSTYVAEALKVCRRPNGVYSTCSPANYVAEEDRLFENSGDGTFVDISRPAGVDIPNGKGLGVLIGDFTGDHRPDIYVTNDGTPNFLFRNDGVDAAGRCHFTDIAMTYGCAVSVAGVAQAGMGIACEDFDQNGWLDLLTTNFFRECCTLYLNQGEGFFEDRTALAGLLEPTRQFLGFGAQSIDYALSGYPGVFIANGHIDDFGDRNEPWKMTAQIFASNGQGRFEDRSAAGGPFFREQVLGRAAARLDFNRDQRHDLIVTFLDRPAALLENVADQSGNAVTLRFVGTVSNRDGLGCRAIAQVGGKQHKYELLSGDGFMACNEKSLVIGLGQGTQIDDLEIIWPSGRISHLGSIPANTSWIVLEDRGAVRAP